MPKFRAKEITLTRLSWSASDDRIPCGLVTAAVVDVDDFEGKELAGPQSPNEVPRVCLMTSSR
jgi:hypothetical protein